MHFLLGKNWREITFVAFDLETTGKYPIDSEICEIGAIKWKDGQIIDEFQTLIKPTSPMSQDVINIHHITNEMVEGQPRIDDKIGEFLQFYGDCVGVAHHAPFDMGFLAVDIERLNFSLPEVPVLCTSLLSRKVIPESPNHRLQTLVKHLGLDSGQAHRAKDDARVCMEVMLECLKRLDPPNFSELIKVQEKELRWSDYSIEALREKSITGKLVRAIQDRSIIQIVYDGGSRPGRARPVLPVGLVRSPNGDFIVGLEDGLGQPKRYLVEKISKVD